MEYLLDTNVLVWLISGQDFSDLKVVYDLQNDNKNQLYYSIVSVWEVAIKHSKNSRLMEMTAKEFVDSCERAGMSLLHVEKEHIYKLPELKLLEGAPEHKDPFDRILIAQSLFEKMTFITGDNTLKWYDTGNIMVIYKG